ncbi:hypothetical protein D1007_52068 [Hordeum vulgare]|nr:hypothetical protein D1007_52068 [Hordeum vulgare]
MDVRAGTPLTPLYSRGPSPAAAAAGNPSAGSGGLATARAPPSIGLARSLFLPPRMTTATGGMGAPPAAMGGTSFDVPPKTHSHENAVENLANSVRTSRDAVRDEEYTIQKILHVMDAAGCTKDGDTSVRVKRD